MAYQNFVLITRQRYLDGIRDRRVERERDKEVHDHVNKERKCSLCYVATGTQFRVSGENGNG